MGQVRVGIVGVSGYGGGELARLLLQHPQAQLAYVTSNTYAGKPLATALPGMRGLTDLVCRPYDAAAATDACDFLFLAGESGLAMRLAPELLDAGKKIVDLSADFRLKDPAAYPQWYKSEHTAAHLLETTVYGLPEFFREQIRTARLVANPGCYPTSAALALAPLLRAEVVDPKTIIVDSLSGVSGAGRSKFGLDYHFSEVNESAKPYGVGGIHRHTPEIEQTLQAATGVAVTLTFTPHLIPITRGILTTAYATLTAPETDLHGLFDEAYRREPFVQVLEPGQFPATKHVLAGNQCLIGVTTDQRTGRAIVISAIDNLIKGTAGQAIQNMNLMCGFAETAGLTQAGVWP